MMPSFCSFVCLSVRLSSAFYLMQLGIRFFPNAVWSSASGASSIVSNTFVFAGP